MIAQTLFHEGMSLIQKAGHILICTHTKPDGDAIGSMVALTKAIRNQGKRVSPLLLSEVPARYAFLVTEAIPVLGQQLELDDLGQGSLADVDLIVLLDVNSVNQLPVFETYLRNARIPVLVIDHHATSDSLGTVEVVDAQAAATGLILFELLKFAGWTLDEGTAEALFVAAATDTGWFQFGNSDSRVYRDCAELIDAGAVPQRIYENLHHNFSYARFKLTQVMLSTLELHFDGQFALQHIRQKDFSDTGAHHDDTENLINECLRIASVQASSLLVELKDGRIRCSLRSRGGVDVSQIARQFGGGGHKMASGTFLSGPLEDAKAQIIKQFEPCFSKKTKKGLVTR
jgi:nanoRNase/pAp phosphatase (c-di-AMP/oligoRNAs hydrolase)